MKTDRLSLSALLLYIMCSTACGLIDPEEPIPATIVINTPVLEVLPGQGSARHKVTEVWLYANNNFEGAVTPPVPFRYVTERDTTSFSFWGGIRNNGILSDPVIYPLFVQHSAQIITSPGTVTEVTPLFKYHPEAVFDLVADFEVQNEFNVNRDTIPESVLVRSDDQPYEGNFSGEIIVDSISSFIEVTHPLALTLPVNGNAVYLEFDYKTEIEMSVGLLGIPLNGQEYSNFFYIVKPSTTWNKVYLELTDLLVLSKLPAYKILFRSYYPPNSHQESYRLQLDNIKVVHLAE